MSDETIVSADGTKLSAFVTGSGPPLVLVHGSTSSKETWAFVQPHLAQEHTVGLGPDDPCTVELVDVNRFRRFSRTNRLTGGLMLAVAINGVLMLAQPSQPDLVVENVTCSEGDEVVLTADVRNTTERVTFGTSLTGTVRVDSGDHFDGSTSIQLEPGDAVQVELATGLRGRVTECEAHVPNSVTRVETNP